MDEAECTKYRVGVPCRCETQGRCRTLGIGENEMRNDIGVVGLYNRVCAWSRDLAIAKLGTVMLSL